MSEQETWFEPFADLEPSQPRMIVACPGYVATAGMTNAGLEIRVARWDGGLVQSHRLGLPPELEMEEDMEEITSAWLSLDRRGSEVALAAAFGDDFGWSRGVMVAPSLDSEERQQFGYPDGEGEGFDFGAPLLLRGDEVFARSPFMLFLARRVDGEWTVEELTDDDFDVEWWWSLALSDDGLRLAVPCIPNGGGHAVVIFARDRLSSPFRQEATLETNDDAVGLCFLPAEGPQPEVAMMGELAVVRIGNRIGVFE